MLFLGGGLLDLLFNYLSACSALSFSFPIPLALVYWPVSD